MQAQEQEMFVKCFKEPVEMLKNREHTGFALMMICFPLLERLLRARVSCQCERLSPEFFKELAHRFPNLKNKKTAREFWQGFRNGILHQATFSLQPVDRPPNWRKQHIPDNHNRRQILLVWAQQNDVIIQPMFARAVNDASITVVDRTFLVDPVAFASEVIAMIEADFAYFHCGDQFFHRMFEVIRIGELTDATVSGPLYVTGP